MLEKITAAEAVREIVAELRARHELPQALAAILAKAREMLEADEAYIMQVERERLYLLAADGLPAGAFGQSLALSEGLEGLAASRGELVTVPDANRHANFVEPFGRERPVGALAAVPLLFGGRVTGVIVAARVEPGQFGGSNLWWLEVIGALAGLAAEAETLRQHQLQAQKMVADALARQEFVGIVSHELKTPVAVIQAYTELLLRRAERTGEDANTDVVRRIADQAERMLALIEQLLDLQRLEAGLFTLEISRFDLAELAGRLLEETQATTQQHILLLHAEGKVMVSADRRRVEEVLQNLVDNAIKYSPAGGPVDVSVWQVEGPDGGKSVVAIRDRGQGIAPEEQKQVFQRFYQGTDHLRRGHAGLGLGLYISREIVRRHGGVMWFESKPGEGSTFYFSLPASGPADE